MEKDSQICYREDIFLEYRSSPEEKRMLLYEKYPYMREIFNDIELKELDDTSSNKT